MAENRNRKDTTTTVRQHQHRTGSTSETAHKRLHQHVQASSSCMTWCTTSLSPASMRPTTCGLASLMAFRTCALLALLKAATPSRTTKIPQFTVTSQHIGAQTHWARQNSSPACFQVESEPETTISALWDACNTSQYDCITMGSMSFGWVSLGRNRDT